MSKNLHLICNAHLDPIWQWEWEEGLAEALSTFRIAADFCEEYDKFVFCHNEALLYRWVEEYDGDLFRRIQNLVKQGKWVIMGGWHLQPDCNMPSGEALVRQIFAGRQYFLEKFGIIPRVAVNVDSFGHSRGLVQIISKSGYNGYLFMRPSADRLAYPAHDFKWVGYDGSEVTAIRVHDGYNSKKGEAAQKVREYVDLCQEDDVFLCLWGIGNHGGGPSKKDLDDIEILTTEMAKQDVNIIHSDPEKYVKVINAARELPKMEKSLNGWAVGCYTSQVRVKQKYRAAENTFFLTEIMCSNAATAGLLEYPEQELLEAIYDILMIQFHDALPGSSIQPAEEMCIRSLDHALEILSKLKARAFIALASGQEKAPADRIPIFAYNPYPYALSGDFVCELMLWDQNWNDTFMMPIVYDKDGNALPTQCEKEDSMLPVDWRKRVVFHATLQPMCLNRFECGFDILSEKPIPSLAGNATHYIFDCPNGHIKINRNTGLVDVFSDGMTNYVTPGAFSLNVMEDDYDPWGMERDGWYEKVGEFSLLSTEQATEFCCVDTPIEAVHVIESGAVRTVVEALFGYKNSRAVVKYILSQDGGLGVDIRLEWHEKQKMVKLGVPAAFGAKACIGEHPYGRETLKTGLDESVAQKYIAICNDDKAILSVNRGTYGSSFDEEKGILYITLLRSPSYTAHPIEGRVTMPKDRSMPYIDLGERDFSFRFKIGKKEKILDCAGRDAQHFNMVPMLLSFYPNGEGTIPTSPIRLAGENVTMNAFKKAQNGNGYIIRLHNPTDKKQIATLDIMGSKKQIEFGKFEIKTLRYLDGEILACDLMEGLLD